MNKILLFVKHFKHDEEGATIVIIAFAFTALSIIAALVIDIGIAYYKTAEIENAADAAALAAGQLLPVDITDTAQISIIKNKALEYAVKNGVTDLQTSDIELQNIVNGYYTKLSINIPLHMETSFARIIGVDSLDVTRNAKVEITPCEKVDGVVPLSIEKSKMETFLQSGNTTHVALKYGGGDGTVGAYGAIDLDGVKSGGANDYELWLAFGYTKELSAGEQLFPVETGNMAGPTNSALSLRYNECTHFPNSGGCTIDHYNPNCPRVVKTPVIEYDSNHYVRIRGFAAFIIEPLSSSGYVYGSFIKLVVSGEESETVNVGDALDFGLYNLRLTN